jgi:hypothetical protein
MWDFLGVARMFDQSCKSVLDVRIDKVRQDPVATKNRFKADDGH